MKNFLFSEHEAYYRELGLVDQPDVKFHFNGGRLYKKKATYLSQFDLFICAFYTQGHSLILTNKFKALGVNTVLCADGIFEFSNAINNIMIRKYNVVQFHPIYQDYFICVGEEENKYFSLSNITYRYLPDRVMKQTLIKSLPVKKRILITTANTAYFNENEFESLISLMVSIIRIIIQKGDDFSFRIFDEALLNRISKSIGIKVFNDIELDFDSTIEKYSSVITTPSSIAITSMYHQRSVALLVYKDVPLLIQSGWNIPSSDVFYNSYSSFFELDRTRIDIQNNILKKYLSDKSLNEHLMMISNKSCSSNNNYCDEVLFNMLNSSFNFNIEFFVRRLYLKIKTNTIIKKIRLKIK